MVASGYIASQAVLATAHVVLLVLAVLQLYSGRWVHGRSTGRLIKLMHLILVTAVVLNAVRMVDPDSVLGLYDSAINQWLSTNVTAIILCAAIFFLLNLVESVATFYGGLPDSYLIAVYVLMVVELLGAELSVAIAMAERRWWPTAIFLFINAPLALILFAGLTYAAHTTRRAVHDSMAEHGGLRDSDEEESDAVDGADGAAGAGARPGSGAGKRSARRSTGGGANGKADGGAGPNGAAAGRVEAIASPSARFKAALSKLLYVQIGASVLLVATAVFCLYFASTRVGDRTTTMAAALRKEPSQYSVASVDWALLLQTLALGCGLAYAWIPLPWERAISTKSDAETAEEDAVFAEHERRNSISLRPKLKPKPETPKQSLPRFPVV